MSTCIWRGSDHPRAVRGRHDEDCGDDQCRGCRPCTERHCICCGIAHVSLRATETALGTTRVPNAGMSSTGVITGPQNGTQQTCPGCIGDVRGDLHTITSLWSELPAQAAHVSRDARPEYDQLMGGDAMHQLAGGGDRNDHGATLPSDLWPVLSVLATWEDDWREMFGHGGGPLAEVDSAANYLRRHLSRAAQEHPAFDEFAGDLRRCVRELENTLHRGERDDTTAAACFRDECGGQLVRKITDEGRSDEYECRRCGWKYDEAHYWLAIKQHYEEMAG